MLSCFLLQILTGLVKCRVAAGCVHTGYCIVYSRGYIRHLGGDRTEIPHPTAIIVLETNK